MARAAAPVGGKSKTNTAFGRTLYALRIEKGLSQELSFRCDIDRSYVSQLERGEKEPCSASSSNFLKVWTRLFRNYFDGLRLTAESLQPHPSGTPEYASRRQLMMHEMEWTHLSVGVVGGSRHRHRPTQWSCQPDRVSASHKIHQATLLKRWMGSIMKKRSI